jgi:hypothetical protein
LSSPTCPICPPPTRACIRTWPASRCRAVFAAGDGLGPYRRLITACAERLDDAASVIIQLHRQVLEATVADLPTLQASLDYELAA